MLCQVFNHFTDLPDNNDLVTSKKNRNGQELGLILTGNFIEKGVIDKKVSLNKFIHQSYKMEDEIKEITTLLK